MKLILTAKLDSSTNKIVLVKALPCKFFIESSFGKSEAASCVWSGKFEFHKDGVLELVLKLYMLISPMVWFNL